MRDTVLVLNLVESGSDLDGVIQFVMRDTVLVNDAKEVVWRLALSSDNELWTTAVSNASALATSL